VPKPELVLVGTADGLAIYRRDPRGALRRVRTALAGASVEAVVAADADVLLVGVVGGPPRQSFDGGETWGEAGGAPPAPAGLQVATVGGPVALAYPRLSSATAYALLRSRPPALLGAGAGGTMLFRSEDEGIHWKPAAMPREPLGTINAIIPSAVRRTAAWAGSSAGALLESIDAGRSWAEVARVPAPILCLAAVVAHTDDGDQP
jgi:photosystem II stability/assembly factor-like uncharacterized protein